MARPFIVLTMDRSGSKHLLYLLRAHPQIKMRAEILNKTFETLTDAELIANAFRVPAARRQNVAAAGFKVLHEQIAGRPFTLTRLLAVPHLKVIVLERRNQLERLRSEIQAAARGNWSVLSSPTVEHPAVHLPPGHVVYWLRVAQAFYTQLTEIPTKQRIWLYYEDLIADQDAVMEPVWTFLGVRSPGPLQVATYRQEARPLADTVANLDELRAALAGTPYAALTE